MPIFESYRMQMRDNEGSAAGPGIDSRDRAVVADFLKKPNVPLLNKRELAAALGLKSPRGIDGWVRSRRISYLRIGHRTLLFSLPQVLADLQKFEVRAVGRDK